MEHILSVYDTGLFFPMCKDPSNLSRRQKHLKPLQNAFQQDFEVLLVKDTLVNYTHREQLFLVR